MINHLNYKGLDNKTLLLFLTLVFIFSSCRKEGSDLFPEDPETAIFNPATDQVLSGKKEFRAVWITTVGNYDWPTTKNNAEVQKKELTAILDNCKALNMNAVVIQIRPVGDAFYKSELEPWSIYLTGTQGVDPGYDPLTFAIEEAHKRNLELHAWLNPYRIGSTSTILAQNHIINSNPSWLVVYNNVRYFNPGIPQVRNHLVDVVKDITTRYNIDAIHFDDYFYPFGAKSTTNPFGFDDKKAWESYANGKDVHLWRSENVNLMVKSVYEAIKATNPKVHFGISPAGKRENSLDLYADPLEWIINKWIDYLVPQIYWEFGHATADFGSLADYWNDNARNVKMFIGMAAYKYKDPLYPAFANASEFGKQIDKVRDKSNLHGEVFYRVKYLEIPELKSYLAQKFQYRSLSPLTKTIGIQNTDVPVISLNGNTINWSGINNPSKSAVYVLVKDPVLKNTFNAKLIDITSTSQYMGLSKKSYFVTSVNSDNVESARSNVVTLN